MRHYPNRLLIRITSSAILYSGLVPMVRQSVSMQAKSILELYSTYQLPINVQDSEKIFADNGFPGQYITTSHWPRSNWSLPQCYSDRTEEPQFHNGWPDEWESNPPESNMTSNSWNYFYEDYPSRNLQENLITEPTGECGTVHDSVGPSTTQCCWNLSNTCCTDQVHHTRAPAYTEASHMVSTHEPHNKPSFHLSLSMCMRVNLNGDDIEEFHDRMDTRGLFYCDYPEEPDPNLIEPNWSVPGGLMFTNNHCPYQTRYRNSVSPNYQIKTNQPKYITCFTEHSNLSTEKMESQPGHSFNREDYTSQYTSGGLDSLLKNDPIPLAVCHENRLDYSYCMCLENRSDFYTSFNDVKTQVPDRDHQEYFCCCPHCSRDNVARVGLIEEPHLNRPADSCRTPHICSVNSTENEPESFRLTTQDSEECCNGAADSLHQACPDVRSGADSRSYHDPKQSNVCFLCARVYARPSTLKTHLRTHSGFRPYQCVRCGKKFSQVANLTAHMRIHSGDRPFQCPICHRSFSQSSSVTTHMRTHSGERPYKCHLCTKAFADSSTLTKHIRVHSGEKPYRCAQCCVRFSQSGNLKRHSRIHMKSDERG
ncbi:unnamed protein product [Echinostoma caproni]|uniref:Protein krueppel n=1 Tax=Echinostoma caproni TaxID=27848 RepID=A0A183B1P3_9TREM|nr:unnamed protein product [Echinostoma caproni]